ncbi:MAG: hypothetical protein ACJ8GN_16110 [Longimicrobiaceae bacterium]
MDEQALEAVSGADASDGAAAGEVVASSAVRPRFDDPESWHDLAERGTPRNG